MRPIDLMMVAHENLAEEFLFVITDAPGFRLSITLEGPNMAGLEALTHSLHTWLKTHIPHTRIDLVSEVLLLPCSEAKQGKIVVSLDFDHTDKAVAVVIDMAVGYVTSFANDRGREVVVLKEGQRFAPLLFQRRNHGASMWVFLPEPLTLRRPPHLSPEGEDVLTKTYQFVAQVLAAALSPYGIDHVSIQPGDNGPVVVKIVFYTGNIRETAAKDIQQLILEVLGHHVAIEGFEHPSTDLVLKAIR